jgi:hypothetical protein
MQILVINGAHLSALLDSGSTNNFVDSVAAACAGVQLTAQHGLRVAVRMATKSIAQVAARVFRW